MHRALPAGVEQWTDDRIDASHRLATVGLTRARQEIESALGEPDGEAIVVWGPTGYGKSLLLQSLRARPPGSYLPRFLPFAHVELGELVSFVSRWLVPSSTAVGSNALDLDEDPMARLLGRDPVSGRQVLLLVDEIQSTPPESLRRLLELCDEHGAAFVGAGLAGPAFDALLAGEPRGLRRIGLTEPWSRGDAALLLDRVAAGAGFEGKRLEAAVDLDSVVRAACGNPRMIRAELAARLRTTNLFPAERPAAERGPPMSLLPVLEPRSEPIDAKDVTEAAPAPGPSFRPRGIRAATPTAAPALVPPRTDWVRPREALAPAAPQRLERTSLLSGLRGLRNPRGLARTAPGHRVRLYRAGLARARRFRARSARVARLVGTALRAGTARCQAAIRDLRGRVGRSMERGGAFLRGAARHGRHARAQLGLRLGPSRVRCTLWIRRPRPTRGWLIGGSVLLLATILWSAGRDFGQAPGALERSTASVALPAERAPSEPDPRILESVSAAPPTALVQLRINAMPWGLVTLDDRALGSTPTSVDVPPGLHRVRVELSDGRVIEEQIIVGEEGSQLAFH